MSRNPVKPESEEVKSKPSFNPTVPMKEKGFTIPSTILKLPDSQVEF
jgi:hypothetical protein